MYSAGAICVTFRDIVAGAAATTSNIEQNIRQWEAKCARAGGRVTLVLHVVVIEPLRTHPREDKGGRRHGVNCATGNRRRPHCSTVDTY